MKNMSGKIDTDSTVAAIERAAMVLRSTLCWLGQVLFTLVFASLVLPALALPYRTRYRLIIQWAFIYIWWLEVICGIRHRVEGLENIPEHPAIVLCKHQSPWEKFALCRYFPPQTWVLQWWVLCIPFFGWGVATLRPIAIRPAAKLKALKKVLEQGRRRLAEGIWVVVFPEGRLVAPGKRERYLPGGAALAEATGQPVVPVAHNAGELWTLGFLMRPGTIRLVIGKPIESTGRSAVGINARAEEWIESTVRDLREGARHPPGAD